MKNSTKGKIVKGLAIGIDVGAPLAATFTQFPLWIEKSAPATMSGLCLMFAALACIPFVRQLKEYFKSPSAPVMWGILFVAFTVLSNIINEMIMVCFFGFAANLLGSFIYKAGNYIGNKPDAETGGREE